MTVRKQALLKRHRRNKRIVITLLVLVLLVCVDSWVRDIGPWWVAPLLTLCFWLAHEAWFADHLFYSPRDDYSYGFSVDHLVIDIQRRGERLHASSLPETPGLTLILECRLAARPLGWLLDPGVCLSDAQGEQDRQDFERGVGGRRYLNLSGFDEALRRGELTLRERFCRLLGPLRLHVFAHDDFASRRLLIVAPHADDAELAAFGLYRRAENVGIVTLTQGEIEADYYERLHLPPEAAARLKGRLRTWDSLAVPLWGGVPTERCVQLGYYCLQLPAMQAQPETPFGSRESGEADIRGVRRYNALRLPADADGLPTWHNLIADLQGVLEHFQPEVLVFPHRGLDPHPDHIAAADALDAAVAASGWKPTWDLLYTNHLHDNDRWPMGPADGGIALPPAIGAAQALDPWSPLLDAEARLDKAMALAMQHDLQLPLGWKKRLRRLIQRVLAGRRWPLTGEDEFFRKAVRRHELFWVRRRE